MWLPELCGLMLAINRGSRDQSRESSFRYLPLSDSDGGLLAISPGSLDQNGRSKLLLMHGYGRHRADRRCLYARAEQTPPSRGPEEISWSRHSSRHLMDESQHNGSQDVGHKCHEEDELNLVAIRRCGKSIDYIEINPITKIGRIPNG